MIRKIFSQWLSDTWAGEGLVHGRKPHIVYVHHKGRNVAEFSKIPMKLLARLRVCLRVWPFVGWKDDGIFSTIACSIACSYVAFLLWGLSTNDIPPLPPKITRLQLHLAFYVVGDSSCEMIIYMVVIWCSCMCLYVVGFTLLRTKAIFSSGDCMFLCGVCLCGITIFGQNCFVRLQKLHVVCFVIRGNIQREEM